MKTKYKLAVAPGAVVVSDGRTIDDLRRAFSPTLAESYEAFIAPQEAKLKQLKEKAFAHQKQCSQDAHEFLGFYWQKQKNNTIQLEEMRRWIRKNEPLDRWFFIYLIEAAAEMALGLGYSQHKSDIAKAKNATPRAWVLTEWAIRTDKQQSKAAFARQYVGLVKACYGVRVTPETIARDWLPKGKT